MTATTTIAIIGAGFSGTMVATHLLLRGVPGGARLLLLDRAERMHRGAAYGTTSEAHLLNVPAGRMSPFPEDEEAFLRFARARGAATEGGSFVPRRVYGDFLEHVLADAESVAAPGMSLVRVGGTATALVPDEARDELLVVLADGRPLRCRRVVLALGNPAPADPHADAVRLDGDPRYVRTPWAPGALDDIRHDDPVVLVGTGLTMVDTVLELVARGHTGAIRAVSRRGLLPQPHRAPSTPPALGHRPPGIESGPATARAYLRTVRAHVAALAEQGIDWREVINSLRPATQRLWSRLPVAERRRFLRHVRPYWEVHRHRMAPAAAKVVEAAIADGRLRITAGRVRSLVLDEEGAAVEVDRRDGARETLRGAHLVNCTGPAGDLRRLGDPFIDNLFEHGFARPDRLGMGLDTCDGGAVVGADGRASRSVFYVGPFLRSRLWECTAVPELRYQAAAVAGSVAESLTAAEMEAAESMALV
jgi:uncharacterized NAD(P)/FAD-binding protein YdhS